MFYFSVYLVFFIGKANVLACLHTNTQTRLHIYFFKSIKITMQRRSGTTSRWVLQKILWRVTYLFDWNSCHVATFSYEFNDFNVIQSYTTSLKRSFIDDQYRLSKHRDKCAGQLILCMKKVINEIFQECRHTKWLTVIQCVLLLKDGNSHTHFSICYWFPVILIYVFSFEE